MFFSLQLRLKLKEEDKEKLIKFMRKQSSAIRVAYRMLLINLVQSLQSEPSGCEGTNGRNPAWQVLKVALLLPILGKILPILVEEVWDEGFFRTASKNL
jgi:hypothetical protein